MLEFISKPVGVYIFSDDATIKQETMNVERIFINTKYNMMLNETYNIGINDYVFQIKLVEDHHEPLRFSMVKTKQEI